jgi:Flp pilus assembly protein TadG
MGTSMLKQSLLNRVARDESGVTAIEFALIAPVFFALMMGTFDVGHRLYMESVLRGAVNKAGRDSALENGSEANRQAAIDTKVRKQIRLVYNSATIDIERKFFRSYNDASTRTHEDFIDGNNNGDCDAGETYSDENHNNQFDEDGAADGQGGARDVVIYSVDVSYPRLFPIAGFIPTMSDTIEMNASTVLTNQPFSSQAVVVTGTC